MRAGTEVLPPMPIGEVASEGAGNVVPIATSPFALQRQEASA